jgi:hypothetical protein
MGGDLTQVLRRPVELAVISGHLTCWRRTFKTELMSAFSKPFGDHLRRASAVTGRPEKRSRNAAAPSPLLALRTYAAVYW